MRKLLIIPVVLSSLIAAAQTTQPAAMQSPAELAIAQASQAIAKNPGTAEPYNALALALARRARETSDVTFYQRAQEALQKSLTIAPDNFGADKTRIWILLGQHEFAKALEAAKLLNQRVPDDVLIYGFMTDANVELGNYEDAEKACNWMLKLRPGNIPGLTRAAYLRELFGEIEGAVQLMTMAYQGTPAGEVEDRAWILTQTAHLKLISGKTSEAETMLQQALSLFPDYHYALGTLAKVRIEQKRYNSAAELLQKRYAAAPHAENLYELAEALELAGKKEEAAKAFSDFEQQSLAESQKADNSNHELIFYYANHTHQPAKALEIAQREYARRHDIHTLDAYAWALHANGRNQEALLMIERALALGVKEPALLWRARQIASALEDHTRAGSGRAGGSHTLNRSLVETLIPRVRQALIDLVGEGRISYSPDVPSKVFRVGAALPYGPSSNAKGAVL
jgi:tetratricopeptide (TPR) repeat protein